MTMVNFMAKLTPEQIGEQGEQRVRDMLAELVQGQPPNTIIPMHDLTLYTGDAKRAMTTQIDHIVISATGILVIETKNWSGTVHGSPNLPYWTQVYASGKKYSVYNPLKQNLLHCQTVSLAVEERVPVFSVVVMVGSADLPSSLGADVIGLDALQRKLDRVFSSLSSDISVGQMASEIMLVHASEKDTASHAERVAAKFSQSRAAGAGKQERLRQESDERFKAAAKAIADANRRQSRSQTAPRHQQKLPPDSVLFNKLRAWRKRTARRNNQPAFVVFDDKTLWAIVSRKPRTKGQLLDVPGIGKVKAERYGADVLSIISSHRGGFETAQPTGRPRPQQSPRQPRPPVGAPNRQATAEQRTGCFKAVAIILALLIISSILTSITDRNSGPPVQRPVPTINQAPSTTTTTTPLPSTPPTTIDLPEQPDSSWREAAVHVDVDAWREHMATTQGFNSDQISDQQIVDASNGHCDQANSVGSRYSRTIHGFAESELRASQRLAVAFGCPQFQLWTYPLFFQPEPIDPWFAVRYRRDVTQPGDPFASLNDERLLEAMSAVCVAFRDDIPGDQVNWPDTDSALVSIGSQQVLRFTEDAVGLVCPELAATVDSHPYITDLRTR